MEVHTTRFSGLLKVNSFVTVAFGQGSVLISLVFAPSDASSKVDAYDKLLFELYASSFFTWQPAIAIRMIIRPLIEKQK